MLWQIAALEGWESTLLKQFNKDSYKVSQNGSTQAACFCLAGQEVKSSACEVEQFLARSKREKKYKSVLMNYLLLRANAGFPGTMAKYNQSWQPPFSAQHSILHRLEQWAILTASQPVPSLSTNLLHSRATSWSCFLWLKLTFHLFSILLLLFMECAKNGGNVKKS